MVSSMRKPRNPYEYPPSMRKRRNPYEYPPEDDGIPRPFIIPPDEHLFPLRLPVRAQYIWWVGFGVFITGMLILVVVGLGLRALGMEIPNSPVPS
jgi:hypothetical protein